MSYANAPAQCSRVQVVYEQSASHLSTLPQSNRLGLTIISYLTGSNSYSGGVLGRQSFAILSVDITITLYDYSITQPAGTWKEQQLLM